MSNKRLIDGTELISALRNDPAMWSLEGVIEEVSSGRFDIPNQGEAARLREALEEIRKFKTYNGEHWTIEWKYELVLGIAETALGITIPGISDGGKTE